jgi:Tol biopolymer transport system component
MLATGKILFGPYSFDLKEQRLSGPAGEIPLNVKSAAVLSYLVQRPQQIVAKEELLHAVWADTAVTDDAMVQRVLDIRKALGDSSRDPQFIRTHMKRGYEFVGLTHILAEQEPIPAAAEQPGDRSRLPAIAMAGVAIAIAAGLALYFMNRGASPPDRPSDLRISQLTFLPGMEDYPVFEPAGQRILYSSDESGVANLWLLDPASGERRKIVSAGANLSEPDWSSDSEFIAYRSEEGFGGLFARSLVTGDSVRIAAFGHCPRWSPDGKNITFHTDGSGSEIYVWDLRDHSLRKLEVSAPLLTNSSQPVWSADGKFIYFIASAYIRRDTHAKALPDWVRLGHQIWRVPAEGGEAKVVTPGTGVLKDGGFDFDHNSSQLVFVGLDRGLWRSQLDPATGTEIRKPERLTFTTQGHQHPRFDKHGGIAFSAITTPESLWLVPFSGEAKLDESHMERLTTGAASVRGPAMSLEGPYVAYFIWQGERFELWLLNLQTHVSHPIGPRDRLSRTSPQWSQDGTSLVYTVIDGRNREWRVARFNEDFTRLVGEHLATSATTETVDRLIREGFVLEGSGSLIQATTHPRFDRTGRFQLQIQTQAAAQILMLAQAGREPVSIAPLGHYQSPCWASDGKRIFFQSDKDGWFNVWSVDFDPTTGRLVGPPRQISFFRGSPYLLSDSNLGFAVQPQGLVLPLRENRSDLWLIQSNSPSH